MTKKIDLPTVASDTTLFTAGLAARCHPSQPQGPAAAAGAVTLGVLRDQIQRSFVPQHGNEGSAFLLTARITG